MSKTRLNKFKRGRLEVYARKVVVFEAEQAAESAAHAALLGGVEDEVGQLASKREMKILRKFGAVCSQGSATFPRPPFELDAMDEYNRAHNTDVRFCFCPRDVHQLPVTRYGCHQERCPEAAQVETPRGFGHGRLGLPAEALERLEPMVEAWRRAVLAHDEARDEALRALRALFRDSRYLEQVVEAWPAAGAVAVSLGHVPEVSDAAREMILGLKVKAA